MHCVILPIGILMPQKLIHAGQDDLELPGWEWLDHFGAAQVLPATLMSMAPRES
jgi:hypothetical protein